MRKTTRQRIITPMNWNGMIPYHDVFQKHKGSKNVAERGVMDKLERSQGQYQGPNYFAVDHANALEQISNRRKQQDSVNMQDGFAPITDSVEKFKVLQRMKKLRKDKKIDDSVYRGQLQSGDLSDNDDGGYLVDDVDEQIHDYDETDMDIEDITDITEDEKELLDK